jgi:hypothetical protein
MKPVRLGDLRELLQGAAFADWWTEYARAVVQLRDARTRCDDLVSQAETMAFRSELVQRTAIEALSRTGDEESAATRATAEAQALENRALELVGRYEEQRFHTSDLWVRLGGAERLVEERREPAPPARPPRDRAKARAAADEALRSAERGLEELRERYGYEDKRRAALWDEVEAAWAASFERSLLGAEHDLAARRLRREAERLFREAEERRARARQLAAEGEAAARERNEAERRCAELLGRARDLFGCAPGEGFLYWRHALDKKSAFAVALADDAEGTNLDVKALAIYSVGARGAAFLEPAREGLAPASDPGDRRFEEYFLGPRKGARRDREGGSSPTDPATP